MILPTLPKDYRDAVLDSDNPTKIDSNLQKHTIEEQCITYFTPTKRRSDFSKAVIKQHLAVKYIFRAINQTYNFLDYKV